MNAVDITVYVPLSPGVAVVYQLWRGGGGHSLVCGLWGGPVPGLCGGPQEGEDDALPPHPESAPRSVPHALA